MLEGDPQPVIKLGGAQVVGTRGLVMRRGSISRISEFMMARRASDKTITAIVIGNLNLKNMLVQSSHLEWLGRAIRTGSRPWV